jgi:hypothetical protein
VRLQATYLTTVDDTVTLHRRHDVIREHDATCGMSRGCRQCVCSTLEVPFVPAGSPPLERWKHFVFRAFARRHVLRLTVTAGSPLEGSALAEFYAALPQLLTRVCDDWAPRTPLQSTAVKPVSCGCVSCDTALIQKLQEQAACAS